MSPRAMTRYVFEEVRYPVSKIVDCYTCGKKVRRSTTLVNTINPWNVDADGFPRSRSQIVEKLRAEASDWIKEPAQCTPCARARLREPVDVRPERRS